MLLFNFNFFGSSKLNFVKQIRFFQKNLLGIGKETTNKSIYWKTFFLLQFHYPSSDSAIRLEVADVLIEWSRQTWSLKEANWVFKSKHGNIVLANGVSVFDAISLLQWNLFLHCLKIICRYLLSMCTFIRLVPHLLFSKTIILFTCPLRRYSLNLTFEIVHMTYVESHHSILYSICISFSASKLD